MDRAEGALLVAEKALESVRALSTQVKRLLESCSAEELAKLVDGSVARAVAEIPRPKDGVDGKDGVQGPQGDQGVPGERGEKGDEGIPGRDGLQGPPGKDALEIEIQQCIEPQRKYQRGTWARHKGGLVRAFRATDPLEGGELEKAGWECMVNGIDGVDVTLGSDARTLSLAIRCSDGSAVEKSVVVPVTIYRGIYDPEAEYTRGDSTTRDGGTWILMADQQKGKPGDEDSGWVLSTKRGRDGRDGAKGEKGDRGAEGRAGKDLTQLGADGRRW